MTWGPVCVCVWGGGWGTFSSATLALTRTTENLPSSSLVPSAEAFKAGISVQVRLPCPQRPGRLATLHMLLLFPFLMATVRVTMTAAQPQRGPEEERVVGRRGREEG